MNAASLAMRFNRTLLIDSNDHVHKLFRPYHPIDLNNNISKFDYGNWSSWTKYNTKMYNNDAYELDLWMCIDCDSRYSSRCGMDSGDSNMDSIRLRGNRVYLCRWNRNPGLQSHSDLIKYFSPNNSSEELDLIEISGCILRTVLWPTETLWKYVEEALLTHELDLKRRGVITHLIKWNYLITTHFRCGDLSYKHGQLYESACIHSEVIQQINHPNGSIEKIYNLPPHSESAYMGYGTPLDLARCVKEVITNHSTTNETSFTHHLQPRTHELHPILHIASDNIGAASQINETLHISDTFLSPAGCHVDLDSTHECGRLTATYFLIMSLSNIIITQTSKSVDDNFVFPVSAFSRYAGIYGLRKDVFRDGMHCNIIQPTKKLGNVQHGNWFCV